MSCHRCNERYVKPSSETIDGVEDSVAKTNAHTNKCKMGAKIAYQSVAEDQQLLNESEFGTSTEERL
jgi:hypothetical protein